MVRTVRVFQKCSSAASIGCGLLLLFALGCRYTPSSTPEQTQARGGQRASAVLGYGSSDYGGRQYDEQRPGRRRSRRGRADTQASPGIFDFYLLNLSWSPEFCAMHTGSPECGRGLGFVVHGLWPQDANGDYPEDCSDSPGPANPQAYTDIIPTAALVEHEWQTHGTCSGLAPDAYFTAVRKAFAGVKIPAAIGAGGANMEMTPQQLLMSFARANAGFPEGSIALSCGNNRLTAIEICLTKDLQPEPCQGVRSCRANVVQVTPK